ncbi:MAG: hypothetical protein J6J42_10170 [Lachnospiraceae bacterium]|nr:hypothetical protein [Lachnospiraceae bacterium]
MRKLCLLCMFVILSVTGISCANQPSVDETTPTTTVEPTEVPVILTATPEPTQEVTPTVTPMVTSTPMPTVTPTPTPVITLSVPVAYHPVELEAEGVTKIQCSAGEGIELDLNGDGVPEQIYTAEEGVYINGILQEQEYGWEFRYKPFEPDYRQAWETYWIVDVDTEDKYYNLIFLVTSTMFWDESLTYYDGILHEISRKEIMMSEEGVFSTAEYFGNGIFVLKGRTRNSIISYYPDVTYCLNKEGGITQIEEYLPLHNPSSLELLETIDMYLEHDLESATVSVEPQTVYMLTASEQWVQFLLEDCTKAWIYVEDIEGIGKVVNQGKEAHELFSGFLNAGQ